MLMVLCCVLCDVCLLIVVCRVVCFDLFCLSFVGCGSLFAIRMLFFVCRMFVVVWSLVLFVVVCCPLCVMCRVLFVCRLFIVRCVLVVG